MSNSPLNTFLPGVNAADGPFALLGLAPEDCTASNIDAALRARLSIIDAHRQANTPEADELRAALHTAAAHLHHPAVRAAAIARFAPKPQQSPQPQKQAIHPPATSPPPSSGPRAAPSQPLPPSNRPPALPIATPSGQFRLPPEEEAYRDMVVRVLVHAGGWNETAKLRLAAVTHLHNRPIRHLQAALRLVAMTGPARRHRPLNQPTEHNADDLHNTDPTLAPVSAPPSHTRPRRLLLAASILFTINSIILLIVFASILRTRLALHSAYTSASPAALAAGEADAATMSSAEARGLIDRASDEYEDTPIARLAAIRSAARALSLGTSASMASFNRNIASLAADWTSLDPPTLQATLTAVSDFVAAAARHDPAEAMRAIDTIASPSDFVSRLTATPRPDQLNPAAFSIATLARLQRDRDLPTTVETALQRRMQPFAQLAARLPGEPAPGPSFDDGLSIALRALAARIAPEPDDEDPEPAAALWSVWIDIADTASVRDPSDGASRIEAVRLDALEHLLGSRPDLRSSPAVLEAARQIVGSIEWTTPIASRRLLRWYDLDLFSRDDLNTLLGWLAVSLPDRVTTELVLPASALPAERTEARDRLALALGAAVRPASEFDEDLLARGNALIARAANLSPRTTNPQALSLTAALASLNEASARRWIQDRAGAEAALAIASTEAIEQRLNLSPSQTPAQATDLAALTSPATGNDGEWALRVLQSQRDRDTLAGLLNQIANMPRTLGPADAGVLIDTALTNTSTPVRDAAQRAVRRHASQPPLIEALLQHTALGRRGLDRLLVDLARDITGAAFPHWSDPRFPIEARKAILATHIGNISEARSPGIVALSREINRIYQEINRNARIGAGLQPVARPGGVPGLSTMNATPDPARAATALADTFQAIASLSGRPQRGTNSLAAIATRRSARLTLGSEGVRRFHAEQVAAVELLAHIVAGEQPALSNDIERVLARLADARAAESSITRQLVAAEAAMAELWIMRLGYHDARRMTPDATKNPTDQAEVPQ